MLIISDNFNSSSRLWTISKNSTILDQGLVSKGTISDEDGGARTDVKGDHRAEVLVQRADDGLDIGEGFT